jgi:cobyrinic acid a,c-diamide synthase
MRHLPRLAVGSIQPGSRREAIVFGLIAALARLGESPLVFRSSCEFAPHDPAKSILGRASRHLDSWAMSRSDAIVALARAAGASDVALVEGAFDCARPASDSPTSSLDRLCQWLDLPRIAIVDVRLLASRGLRLPMKLDGILLDRVRDSYEAAYWQTTLEALWNTPIVGWLDEATGLRALCATLPAGRDPSRELCDALARRLAPTLRLGRLSQIANKPLPLAFATEDWLLAHRPPFRVAVAMDEIYSGCYPESFDLLEAAGAELCDFSPLRSEAIPENVDVVYIGCGHPERDALRLAANHCLKQSLRSYAARGGRIYAEGSGVAYLCDELVSSSGRSIPMTGLLPAKARYLGRPVAEPAEVSFQVGSWLAPADMRLRGYRNSGWDIQPRAHTITYATSSDGRAEVFGCGTVIGSRVLVNLAANRHLLRRFFEPYTAIPATARREM